MTRVLESTVPGVTVVGTAFPEHGTRTGWFVDQVHGWDLFPALLRLQKVHREGRVEEQEAAIGDYFHQVRQQGGDPRVHFFYALGLLALDLSQRDPERSSSFKRVFIDHVIETEGVDAELSFRKGLERISRLSRTPREWKKGDRLDRVKDHILAHFQGPIQLQGIAAEFGFSASALGRGFNERFGKGFSAFLRDLRVGKARELLTEGRLPVEQVSRESGFKNFHYFFEVFKRATGQTPQKFRKTHSGLTDKF